jgi:p-cumate 2,3-dioxygenase beta subunit
MTHVDTDTDTDRIADPGLRPTIEDFLFREANLLDAWRLEEWLGLFALDGRYLVPSTDAPTADPARDLYMIHDDRFLLDQRVRSLLKKTAHAEYPRSRTRRIVGNVQAGRLGEGRLWVTANFILNRMRHGHIDCYIGHYDHVLSNRGGHLEFVQRKAILDNEALRPQGKISVIL